MTMDEIKLWVVDGSKPAVEVPGTDQAETERMLEDILVANPDLLMPELTLVGRQTPTEGGQLDLLGVDGDGRLVVFELKRGTLSRDAVAQVIDYASSLDAMNDSTLAQHISVHSGAHGVDKVEDFENQYDLTQLRPVRMVLVGLGADQSTSRMVRFLADRGIDISLLTFHGYKHNGKTLLARQVRVETSPSRRPSQAERLEQLEGRIRARTQQWEEGYALWNAVCEMFSECFHGPVQKADRRREDWAQHRLNLYIGRRGPYASVQLGPQDLIVIFHKKAVELRLKEFTRLRKEIKFYTYPEVSPNRDAGAIEIKFRIDSLAEWDQHKGKLASVTRSVYEAVMGGDED